MNPCGEGEGNWHPVTSTCFPFSVHNQLQASQTEQNSSGEKPTRIKRRRTRRERNCVRYGKNSTKSVLEHRPCCSGVQKALPPFWSSHLPSCAKPASFKGTSGAKPVIITQNRLSKHLGMFNNEVKSVDIERLLNPRCEQEFVEVTPLRRDSGVDMQMGEESQTDKYGGSDQKSIPCEQPGSIVKNSSGMNEDSLPILVPPIFPVVTEHCSRAPVHATDPGSQSLAAAVEVDQQSELQASDPCQINGPVVIHEKENIPPVSPGEAKSHRGKSLAKELAQDLEKLLDVKSIFPGRNLINETRQAIISALLEQKQKLPDFSALGRYKKLAGSSKGHAVQTDFESPAARDQELPLDLESSGDSRSSSQGISLKKRKGQDVFFLTSPSFRMDEGRPSRREDVDFFTESDRFDQQTFCLAAVQHPPLLSSWRVNSAAESSLASEGQRLLQEPVLRTAWPWEQGPRDALREPQRQERAKVAHRPLQRKSAPQRHCLPFSTWDSWNQAYRSTDERCSRQFDSQQYSYINELGSEQWSLQEAQPAPVHSQHFPQEPCDPQSVGVGLRAMERAASESQTSFDILKSILSPNLPSNRARGSVPQVVAHQPSSSRELNSDQEDFLQLCSISPEQTCFFSPRQNSQQEMRVPSRHPQNGHRMFSGLAKPRSHCQKVDLEPGRIPSSYQLWGPREPSARTQATSRRGCPASRTQACHWERQSQVEGLLPLRLLQQLPMSYFPPSEALENKRSPLSTLQTRLQGRSSPEPWAFPRMKLY